jgi:hypothetical protein
LIRWSKKRSIDKTQAVPGATGSTALHVGCANGCIKVVDLLIRNNARVDVKDKYGSTPLDVAQARHETEIVKILKQAEDKQKQKRQKLRSSCIIDENESKTRKSIDGTLLTHKRTGSDREPRMRRPSLPSIFEDHHQPLQIPNIPSNISMTPSSSFQTKKKNNSLDLPPAPRCYSSSEHRPSFDEMHLVHSCPVTPSSSIDHINKRPYQSRNSNSSRSPRSSEDSSAITLSASPHISVCYPTDDYWIPSIHGHHQSDWYGHGVLKSYDDENYLLSLERRAFNMGPSKNSDLERSSGEFTRRSNDSTYHCRFSSGSHSIATDDNIQQQDPFKLDNSADSGIGGKQLHTTALKNAMAVSSAVSLSTNESPSPSSEFDEEYEEEEEKAYNSEPLPRPSLMLDNGPETDMMHFRILYQERRQRPHSTDQETIQAAEAKKRWFIGFSKDNTRHSFDSSRKSLDRRSNFDNITQFAKRGISSLTSQDEEGGDPSDEGSPPQKSNGFFSRWAPAWGRK